MVLSLHAVDSFTSPSTLVAAVRARKSSYSLPPLPAFHYTDTDNDHNSDVTIDGSSGGDEMDGEIDGPPTFHYESDCDTDSRQRTVADDKMDDWTSRRSALTVSIASSPSHSTASIAASPHTAAVHVSPTNYFASPSFASLLSSRVAVCTPTATSCSSPSSSSPHSFQSSSLPCYSPHSSCVKPSVFAWQLEEAAVLFWERKTALTTTTTTSGEQAHCGHTSTGDDVVRPPRFVYHSRHATL